MIVVFAVAAVFGLLWSVMVVYGLASPPPTVQEFVPRSQIESSLLRSVSIDQISRAITQIPGAKVVNRDSGALIVSLSPSIQSIERGTGAWAKVSLGKENWLVQIRAKAPLGWVSYNEAVVEFDREMRMALGAGGSVSFDIREGVTRPNIPTAQFQEEAQLRYGTNGKWWE